MKPLCDYLERTLISPYISEMNATEKRVTNPVTCSICISLIVNVTAIAEGAVRLLMLCTIYIILNTTICGMRNLCVVQCRCFVDLLLNQI